MRVLLFVSIFLVSGCATRYILPGNRFLTPETQGGFLRGQAEVQATNGVNVTVDGSRGSVNDGVVYSVPKRTTAYQLSTSLFDPFDLYWSHLNSGNSLFGGKYQFMGGSRTAKGDGHRMAVALAVGGNDFDTDNNSSLHLGAEEVLVLYGYRMGEYFLPYSSLSYGAYDFSGTLRSSVPALNGQRPHYKSKIISLSAGLEFGFWVALTKVEFTYQRISTTYTRDESRFIMGYSFGVNW